MVKYWLNKLKESAFSALPILAVIFLLFILQKTTFSHMNSEFFISDSNMISFLICSLIIIIGLTIFSVGSESSMSQIGEIVGVTVTKKKNLFFVIAMAFVLGICVTVAEPDLSVLSTQIGVNKFLIIGAISVGVGIFLVIGVLRVLFSLNLNVMFLAFYALVFCLANLVNPKFLPICFDSGGVTTGPVTVPFILAFGLGIAASKKGGEDSFGFTALASVGPIISVMIISMFVDVPNNYDMDSFISILDLDFGEAFGQSLLSSMGEVGIAVLPIVVFFFIYNFAFVKLPIKKIYSILIGLVFTFIGLSLFLGAVKGGFQPVAIKVGLFFGNSGQELFNICLVFAFLFGLFGVLAEPAVQVLVRQIENISEGTIKKSTVLIVLAISIGLAVMLSIIRAYFGFSVIYYLIPGYVIALSLSFVVPKIYTAIAFDSGGVASGPMTSTFILPFAIGFAYSYGTNNGLTAAQAVYENGFGLVSMVAMMPLIVLQGLGLYAKIKQSVIYSKARKALISEDDNQIIHLLEEE